MKETREVFIPRPMAETHGEVGEDSIAGEIIQVGRQVIGEIHAALHIYFRDRKERAKVIYLGRGTRNDLLSTPGVGAYLEPPRHGEDRLKFDGVPIYVVDARDFLRVGP